MKKILFMTVSIDGKTTKGDDDTSWVSVTDIERMDILMCKSGVMVMGSNTYKSFGDDLPNNNALMIVFTNNKELLNININNVRFTSEKPNEVFKTLENEGYKEVMIAGGADLNTILLNNDLIDEIRLIVRPIVIGIGKTLFNKIDVIKNFKFNNFQNLENGTIEVSFVKDDLSDTTD